MSFNYMRMYNFIWTQIKSLLEILLLNIKIRLFFMFVASRSETMNKKTLKDPI